MFFSRKGRFISSKASARGKLASHRLKDSYLHDQPADVGENEPVGSFEEVSTVDSNTTVFSGRRIVELGHIIDQLRQCGACGLEINLTNTKSEQRYGFGSVLTVECTNCGFTNKIETNKRHRHDDSQKGPKTFVINTKAAIGMLHSGIGLTHINNFMSAIEVPTVHHTTMNKIESKVGVHVRSLAKRTCKASIKEEAAAQRTHTSTITSSEEFPAETHSPDTPAETHIPDTPAETHIPDTPAETHIPDTPAETHIPDTPAETHIPDTPAVTHIPDTPAVTHIPDTPAETHIPDTDHSYSRTCTPVSGEFKYDMGWQKRGSGRSYDSKSGVGTLIGNRTGKICAYDIRIKACKLCDYHKSKNTKVPKHRCCRNWTGSSKSMEADVGGELVKDVEKENVDVGVIIMDDDCTTICKIKQQLSHDVEKWSDQNHTVKHLGNSLYLLQKKHKVLTTMVIKHIQKCFNYALAQNKGNVENFTTSLKLILPHLFGQHDSCGSWCGFKTDPDHYKHAGLPYGKKLSGDELRADLEAIFKVFIGNASKIAPGGSTKDVESFNNMISAKAPKRIHYSSSESLKNRVGCAVAQKNIGCSYVNSVNISVGVSPGEVFESHAKKLDRLRKRRSENEQNITFKRRRLQRKLIQKHQNAQKESREGVTYQSGIANSLISEVADIPTPVTPPVHDKLASCVIARSDNVFCDIETTSLHKDADIVQIAASCGTDSFNQYILPEKHIAPSASDVTGLTMNGCDLLYHGQQVYTVALKEALQLFLAWLDTHQPCILIGHNFQKFDFPRIFRSFEISHLTKSFQSCVLGIVDTLPLFKNKFKNLEKYSQEHLVTHFVKEEYSAHNALGDVQSLENLCKTVGVTDDQLSEYSWTIDTAVKLFKYHQNGGNNVGSLAVLKNEKVLSKGMIEKIANSGLSLQHLKLAVDVSGLQGLTQVFSENVNGKPRVTKSKRITENLFNYLK